MQTIAMVPTLPSMSNFGATVLSQLRCLTQVSEMNSIACLIYAALESPANPSLESMSRFTFRHKLIALPV